MIRRARRSLSALLTLLVPLAFLAYFGSAELSRQAERAETALREQANSFLRNAVLRFEELVRSRAHNLLNLGDDLSEENLVVSARTLVESTRGVLDLFLLDGKAMLVFPSPPPTLEASFPNHGPLVNPGLASAAVVEAALLEQFGDLDGAAALLEQFLEQKSPPPGAGGRPLNAMAWLERRLRAAFDLGGIRRRQGRLEDARLFYREAMILAGDMPPNPAGRRQVRDAAPLELLSILALAEMSGPPELIGVLSDISKGLHDEVADDLLAEVCERIRGQIPAEAREATELRDVFENERHRRLGRRFASEYQRLGNDDVLRRRLEKHGSEPLAFYTYAGADATSLLAVRAAKPDERSRRGAEWVGLRLDIALLVNQDMDSFLTPDETGFYLEILDPDGTPVLRSPRPEPASEPPFLLPTHPSLGGLQLRAVPANPLAILESRRASVRTNALLVIALCLVAGGGAFFLLRSVGREVELAAMKVDLVSRVSHELKTPLALIKMYAETVALGRTKDQDQLLKFAGIITREADRLTAMIQRILDFSRQQAGSVAFRKESVDLAPMIEWVAEQYRPHVEASGMALVTRIEGDALVAVDRAAAESALLNLLENALKYTPRDAEHRTIEVELRCENGTARIDVLDRGIGVPAAERELIFSSFYRATNAGEVRGAGLGLGLVRHFAEAHGGSVQAVGREGGGSIFRLTLPSLPPDGLPDEARA